MRKPTKIEIIISLAVSYCVAAAVLTPSLITRAYIERGYFAFGGEYIPVVSIAFVLVVTVIYYFIQL